METEYCREKWEATVTFIMHSLRMVIIAACAAAILHIILKYGKIMNLKKQLNENLSHKNQVYLEHIITEIVNSWNFVHFCVYLLYNLET